jgi:hypothetical protein
LATEKLKRRIAKGSGVHARRCLGVCPETANFGEDVGPVAQQISIRNAAFCGFSPLFMRLVAVARIEALF